MMGIPGDYNDNKFKVICHTWPPEYTTPINPILSIPKDQKVLQECVGGWQSDVVGQMAMAEPGNVAKQMAEAGNVTRAPLKMVL